MAKSLTPVRKARRALIGLAAIFVVLIGLNAVGAAFFGGSWAPKLALDLEGGTQIRLAPQVEGGSVSSEQVTQAVAIIRQRIDASGVSESEITTEGANNIVVNIPGQPDEETLNRIEASAKLDFRPVLLTGAPATASVDGSTPTPTPTPDTATTPAPSPTDASDPSQITPELQQQFTDFSCDKVNETTVPDPNAPFITCDVSGSQKYLLGPVELGGQDLTDASATVITTQTGASTGNWGVNLQFNSAGADAFGKITQRLTGLESPRNQFAVVLDNKVIVAPQSNAVITDGRAQITGSFTQETANTLANQLKYGALPISFVVQSQDTISATLGSEQLQGGLIAGLIGLILVVGYSLFQYRTLGLVTVASLVVAAALTYLLITYLSWREGYRLSLAGVAGTIVAIGITADSFIVYFERIRDELRDGRGLEGAIEAGWKRALRTITASDAVNFLAAIVLFILAVGNVRGFALTLGLTTVIDLIVVILFTHPILQLLGRTRFFSEGHRFSGLDPRALGAVYRGRAQFREPAIATSKKAVASRGEAVRRQTIAERKAAEAGGGVATLVAPEKSAKDVSSTTNETTTPASQSNRGKKGKR